MESWVSEILSILSNIETDSHSESKAIENAIHVFKYGNGWLTDGPIKKIFFFSDFNDSDAVK